MGENYRRIHKFSKKRKNMFDPAALMEKAKSSKKHLALLNFGLLRMIPFNKPHGFKVKQLSDHEVTIHIPFKRANFNHIKGIHACALATASEYATGLVLLHTLGAKTYRIIMQKMEMEYHYQAKQDAEARFQLSEEWLDKEVKQPIATHDSVVVCCEVKTFDQEENHLTTGKIYWQIKPWDKVKTKT